MIKDFANEYTRSQAEDAKQSILILIYPESHSEVGRILECFESAGHAICRARSVGFTLTTAREFFDRFFVKGHDTREDIQRYVKTV